MVTAIVSEYDDWRAAARRLLEQGVAPDAVVWSSTSAAQRDLPLAADVATGSRAAAPAPMRVPRPFATLAETVACHRNPAKWERLYRLLWRVRSEGRSLLELESDPLVREVRSMDAQVRRDEHSMRAFVRFTPVAEPDGDRYVAWYQPDHLIVRRAAPFFADRFRSIRWSILTPDLSAHWDGDALRFSAGVPVRLQQAAGGAVEELWRAYYAAVFNPARLNLRATMRDMPLRRWRGLPEAALIPSLTAAAHEMVSRAGATTGGGSARPFLPEAGGLTELRAAAAGCRGCDLYERATQTVFGEGDPAARLVLVGEQPGDAEDLAGRPFVGPAGRVLDEALASAGIDRRSVYLTNAVKHFSFEPRGKRRIHQTPRLSEVRACRPWLEAELQALRPAAVVCLGSTAARALLGPQARVMALRGRPLEGLSWAERVFVTVHPSAVLRSEAEGTRYFAMLVEDLSLAAHTRERLSDEGDR